MGGKVLRLAGAALLTGLFLAATTAHGQTVATDQTQKTYSNGQALAAVAAAENPGAEAPYPGVAFRGPEGPRFHQPLLPPTPRFHLLDDSPLSSGDSGDAELPSAPAAIVTTPLDQSSPYEPITARERLSWGIKSAIWPEHLAGGIITSAVGTGLDRPREDGTHWGGFAERYGVRLTGVATSNVMEGGFGALWGEDPRYFRVPELSYRGRVWNVVRMAFLARRRDGHYELAYARFIAFPGNNFLTNAWRPDSEANVHDAVLRSLGAFAGRIASNAWNEFWPQTKAYLFHRGDREP